MAHHHGSSKAQTQVTISACSPPSLPRASRHACCAEPVKDMGAAGITPPLLGGSGQGGCLTGLRRSMSLEINLG
ncbi:MAG TPA: hypothetical protein VMV92_00475 [Streptosporangiaceae bacterium]|nr:hypothetical protein [Streptosporangiaceae bacterium]